MEWNYQNVIIKINNNGKFYFSINGKIEKTDSLEIAKSLIDRSSRYYYTFSKEDIDKLCKKLDKRESEFVRALINELKLHKHSAYCEIGISNEMMFDF